MLLLGGRALSAAGLEAASRVAAATGARVLADQVVHFVGCR
jgi:hypothetical protein